jgi:DNA-binding transcriptional ArsR family regulator
MLKPDMKVGALRTFLQQLDKLDTRGKPLRYFRGHSKQSFQLKPSIFRNSGWIANEAAMLRELILRCPNDFSGGLTTFQCLVKMQHYGLPTRLLDVTSNPLVALYFASESHEQDEEDGEVLAFGYDVDSVKYFDSDTVSVIANLSRRSSDFAVPEPVDSHGSDPEKAIERFNSLDSIKLLLHDIGTDKPHFLPKIKREDLERVVCVKPLLDNPRIIRQEGAFLLFGCNKKKREPARLEESAIVARLIINRDEKQNLREQLRTLGITRATMYPEIEHVAMHIRQSYYIPRIDRGTLSSTQETIFGVLRGGGEYSVQDVARAARVRPAAVSRAMSELQRKGAVTLVGSGRERRWKWVAEVDMPGGDRETPSDTDPGEPHA